MIADQGDTRIVEWNHRDPVTGEPFDPETVTATVTPPGGVAAEVTVSHPGDGDYTIAVTYATPGDWRIDWYSTGPAEHDEIAVYALPEGLAAPWAPSLREVAAHIPSRTRQAGTPANPGDNIPANTFNDFTEPSGDVVQSLIDRAVGTVTGRLGTPIVVPAYAVASAAAALWAAYWVELGWPERDGDVQVWAQLRADAEAVTVSAVAVNVGNGGGTTAPDADAVITPLAVHSFPAGPRWADALL